MQSRILLAVVTCSVFTFGDRTTARADLLLPEGTQASEQVTLQSNVVKLDVHFSVATTGSMQGEIANLQTGLTATVIPGATAIVADTAFGVSEYEDFPYNTCNALPGNLWCTSGTGAPPAGIFGWEPSDIMISYGWTCGENDPAGDRPFKLLAPIGGDALGGVNNLANLLGCGLDTPASGWEALYQIATGDGWPSFTDSNGGVHSNLIPAFVPSGPGTIGGVGFRSGSLPLIVHVTDSINHVPAEYDPFFTGSRDAAAVTAALAAIAARVTTMNSWSSGGSDPQSELATLASATGAAVPSCAWSFDADGNPAARPPGCIAGQCCTGLNGVGVPPTGGTCPLAFRVSANGVGSNVALDGILRATRFAPTNVRVAVREDPSRTGGLCLVKNVTPVSGTDPYPGCSAAPTPVDPDPQVAGDERFDAVTPGAALTFDVVGENDCIAQTPTAQEFGVIVDVLADGVALLDSRTVTLTVPAETVDKPVSGVKLILKRTPSGVEKMLFISKDSGFLFPIPGGADDPTSGGAMVEILSLTEGVVQLMAPASLWSVNGPQTMYKFGNPSAPAGPSPIKLARLKSGKLLKVRAATAGLPLAQAHGSVAVRITTGTSRNCARFTASSSTITRDEPGKFIAKAASASGLPDCSDASLTAP